MVEHDVLVAVERLVKVDALDTLGHILPRNCSRYGPHVAEPKALGSIGPVARPLQHVVPFVPGHAAGHVGAVDLPLLPRERARLAIMPVQPLIHLRRVAAQVVNLQSRSESASNFAAISTGKCKL